MKKILTLGVIILGLLLLTGTAAAAYGTIAWDFDTSNFLSLPGDKICIVNGNTVVLPVNVTSNADSDSLRAAEITAALTKDGADITSDTGVAWSYAGSIAGMSVISPLYGKNSDCGLAKGSDILEGVTLPAPVFTVNIAGLTAGSYTITLRIAYSDATTSQSEQTISQSFTVVNAYLESDVSNAYLDYADESTKWSLGNPAWVNYTIIPSQNAGEFATDLPFPTVSTTADNNFTLQFTPANIGADKISIKKLTPGGVWETTTDSSVSEGVDGKLKLTVGSGDVNTEKMQIIFNGRERGNVGDIAFGVRSIDVNDIACILHDTVAVISADGHTPTESEIGIKRFIYGDVNANGLIEVQDARAVQVFIGA